jgi:type II restriction enzyme
MNKEKIKSLIQSKKLDINELSNLIEEEKENYIAQKVKEYIKKGINRENAINKANQSWRTFIGNHLQDLIIEILTTYFQGKVIKIIKDSNLKSKNLSKELDLVKRMLLIHFGNYSFLQKICQKAQFLKTGMNGREFR